MTTPPKPAAVALKLASAEEINAVTHVNTDLEAKSVFVRSILGGIENLISKGILDEQQEQLPGSETKCWVFNQSYFDKHKKSNSDEANPHEHLHIDLPVAIPIYSKKGKRTGYKTAAFPVTLVRNSGYGGQDSIKHGPHNIYKWILALLSGKPLIAHQNQILPDSGDVALDVIDDDDSTSDPFVVSMKCSGHHVTGCVRPGCVMIELCGANTARTGCPGPNADDEKKACAHKTKCAAPGSMYLRLKDVRGLHLVDDLMKDLKDFLDKKLRLLPAENHDAAAADDSDAFEEWYRNLLKKIESTRSSRTKTDVERTDNHASNKTLDLPFVCFFGNLAANHPISKKQIIQEKNSNVDAAFDLNNFLWNSDEQNADGTPQNWDNGWLKYLIEGRDMIDSRGQVLVKIPLDLRLRLLDCLGDAFKKHVWGGVEEGTHTGLSLSTVMELLAPALKNESDEMKLLVARKIDKCADASSRIETHHLPFHLLFDSWDNTFSSIHHYVQISHQNHCDKDFRINNLIIEVADYKVSRCGCAGPEKNCWHVPGCGQAGTDSFWDTAAIEFSTCMAILNGKHDPVHYINHMRLGMANALANVSMHQYLRSLGAPDIPRPPDARCFELPDDWDELKYFPDKFNHYFHVFLTTITRPPLVTELKSIINSSMEAGPKSRIRPGQIIAAMYFDLLPKVLDELNVPKERHNKWKYAFFSHLHPYRKEAFHAIKIWFKNYVDERPS